MTIYTQICDTCNKSFNRSARDLASRRCRNVLLSFCSRGCHKKYRQKQASCLNCNATFIIPKCQDRKFCSKSCAAKYNNVHKTKGTKRSKLEQWIELRLTELYPNLEMHFNRKDTIGSELDIYIPSLKLAFELNGLFHYEPIFGTDKLKQIQDNDTNKFQKCQKLGISLCIIDTSGQKYFKQSTSQKYLNIIVTVISQAI